MAYTRPPAVTRAGVGLKQTPAATTQAIIPVVLDGEIASATTLGLVKIGSGISVTPDGTISSSGGSSLFGTWTPQLVQNTSGSIGLIINNANYVLIGKLVICTFDFTISNITGGSNNTILRLDNLPYISINSDGYTGSLLVSYFNNMNSNIDFISGTVNPNSFLVDLWYTNEQSKSVTKITQNVIKIGTKLTGTITYFTN